ncbi:MAG: hypothetical protein ACREX7_08195 [Casimicrobiaceae bacterium]
MRTLTCLVLIALLSACIPIGVRGTSVVDAGPGRTGATSPGTQAAWARSPARPLESPRT